ncbi:hypothetical protein Q6375_08375 [Clostridium septicum]|uniref:hypothetical protein n=1 Tax=Clostridium septicum TaxID=1504 RepID=UPI00272DCB48|nr:hypothetical protein [Clostridium septicum]WLF70981.1 hypothetical protein Q6375_08375 [Clostridium septicum]
MKRYNEEIIELLDPPAKKCYISLCRKSNNIYNKITLINELNKKVIKGLPLIQENDKCEILNNIYEVSEYFYSCMEYVGQIIRSVCKISIKEELKDGFNSVLNDINKFKDGKKQSIAYSNIAIRNYISQSEEWYNIIHCIRTEETHYGTGEIQVNDKDSKWLIYKNTLRNGKGNIKEIHLSLNELSQIYFSYCMFVDQLDTMIKYIYNLNESSKGSSTSHH